MHEKRSETTMTAWSWLASIRGNSGSKPTLLSQSGRAVTVLAKGANLHGLHAPSIFFAPFAKRLLN